MLTVEGSKITLYNPSNLSTCNTPERQREIFVGSLNFWAMLGAAIAQTVSDRYGRRMTFIMAANGFLVGIFILIISSSYGMLLCGRMFIGWGVGTGLAIDPLYISEVTPAKHRGELVTDSEQSCQW